jgi:hypothetical protein
VVGLGLGAALLCTAASAQEHWSAAERARIFATLPNWSGLWESKLSTESDNLTGYPSDLTGNVSDYARVRLELLQRDFELSRKPPYKPGWEQTQQAKAKSTAIGAGGLGICRDAQFPTLLELPLMFQVSVTPEETLFLYENGDVRHIYTDGRKHPQQEDLWPTKRGNSIGHWEGSTLVIDTIEVTPGPMQFPGAADLSDQARFTERVRMVDANTLRDDLTIDDPVRFAHPWQVSIRWSRVLGQDRMLPYDCGNDRNPVVSGKMTVAPPQ